MNEISIRPLGHAIGAGTRWMALAVRACASLLLVLGANSPWAATYRVGIGDHCDAGVSACFTPSELMINVGDSVEFYNYADTLFTGFHNVVADDGSFRCAVGCDGEGGDGNPISDSICDGTGFCVWNPLRLSFTLGFSAHTVVTYHDEVSTAAGMIIVGSQPSFTLAVSEIYSSADGSAQFILFWPGTPGSLMARALVSSSGAQQHTYVFPNDLPVSAPGGRPSPVLLATQGFADLHLVKPDFIVPNGFLFAAGGSISVQGSAYTYAYGALPPDGGHALYPAVDADIGAISYAVGPAVAVNHAREYAALAPIPILEVIEYYNAALDDYFLTAYPEEIAALDAGRIPGWQRTGYGLPTWSGPPADAYIIPGLDPVCRVFLGVTHYFSLGGCADAMALPGSVLETGNAFYAVLPDLQTGTCPAGQVPVFRLWNPRSSSHRYTTQSNVRQDMLSRGFIAEGYGRDGVAMCVPGSPVP